jgi:hypothetical protein
MRSHKTMRNEGFSYYFCLIIEGSGSGSRIGCGAVFVPCTNGSESGSGGGPKHQIPNNGLNGSSLLLN